MNGTSFLLLLVFLVAGYVIQPLALPKLQKSGFGITKADDADKKKPKVNVDADADDTAKKNTPEDKKPRITDEPTTPADTANANNGDSANQMPKVEPKPEPKPEPNPVVEPQPATFTEEQAINAMQSSIKSAKITEFQFAQVKDWKFTGEETINGETYQVGVASYTAKTLFGDQTHDAKALFKDGKLVKWVWAANNFEMK